MRIVVATFGLLFGAAMLLLPTTALTVSAANASVLQARPANRR